MGPVAASAGLVSDRTAAVYGMRGRLWTLWSLSTAQGVACIVLGLVHQSLPATIALLVIFSTFVQASAGATFGVVPFVSKRALGVVSGLVGAGGNAGAVLTQRPSSRRAGAPLAAAPGCCALCCQLQSRERLHCAVYGRARTNRRRAADS
jgi:nitrate/nitrite transporter NarK